MEFKDYYQVLQVETQASPDDIRQAYRRLVQKFHPDINPATNAEERFKEIQEAYDILKDTQKRTLYNYSYKTIKPYTYDWIRTKIQGWWYIYAQARAKRQASARAYAAQRPNSSSLPLFLLGSGILLLLITLVSGLFILQPTEVTKVEPQTELTEPEKNHLVTAILQGNPEGIEKLNGLPLNAQMMILQQTGVKHAIINFFINHSENDIIVALQSFDVTIQEKAFKHDETIRRLLMAHYYRLADENAVAENFEQAFRLLDTLNSYLEDLPGFATKYDTLQMQKNERLAELTTQYKQCLTLSERPLLEKTPCFESTRQSIARIEPTHPILTEPNLNVTYATAIEQALTENAFKDAEQLIAVWQKLFPQQDKQRQAFQQRLTRQHQFEKVVSVLARGDNKEIAQNLGYLKNVETPLQEEILKKPKVRENLLKFHMKELLILMQRADKPVQPYLQLVEQFDPEAETSTTKKTLTADVPLTTDVPSKTPVDTSIAKNKINTLLKRCEAYYQVKHLTKGEKTALSCYKAVLARDPKNATALAGLEKLEHLFQIWAENALQRSELNKVKYYLLGLEKVNPQASALTELRKRLHWEKAQQAREARIRKQRSRQQSAQVTPPAVTPRRAVTPRQQVSVTKPQPTPQRRKKPSPAVVKKTESPTEKKQNTVPQCTGCSCTDLFRQLSMGVKPLTANQSAFLSQCY